MLTDMVTTLLLFRGFRVTRDPLETGYVRVLQGLRSNSLIPYGIRLQHHFLNHRELGYKQVQLSSNHCF